MPKKQEVLDSLDKENYTKKEVETLIRTIRAEGLCPPYFKKGDIYSENSGGNKSHPHVIVKIIGDRVISMMLSTTEGEHTLCKCHDRFFESNYTLGFMTHSISQINEKYLGTIENNRILNKAIKLNKEFILKNI